MKLSKSLLASMAVGLALTTVTSSCNSEFITPNLEDTSEVKEDPNGGEGTCDPNWEDCPACGLG